MNFITHSKILAKPDIKFESFCEFRFFARNVIFLMILRRVRAKAVLGISLELGSDILTISFQFQSNLRSPEKSRLTCFLPNSFWRFEITIGNFNKSDTKMAFLKPLCFTNYWIVNPGIMTSVCFRH